MAVDPADPGDEIPHLSWQGLLRERGHLPVPPVLHGHRVHEPVGLRFPGDRGRPVVLQPGPAHQGLHFLAVAG